MRTLTHARFGAGGVLTIEIAAPIETADRVGDATGGGANLASVVRSRDRAE